MYVFIWRSAWIRRERCKREWVRTLGDGEADHQPEVFGVVMLLRLMELGLLPPKFPCLWSGVLALGPPGTLNPAEGVSSRRMGRWLLEDAAVKGRREA